MAHAKLNGSSRQFQIQNKHLARLQAGGGVVTRINYRVINPGILESKMNHVSAPCSCGINGCIRMPYLIDGMIEVKYFLMCVVACVVGIVTNRFNPYEILCVSDVVVA